MSSVFSNMCPCVAGLEKRNSNGGFMSTELWIIYIRSISNLPNSHETCALCLTPHASCLMPHFSTNEWLCTASDHNHAHLIQMPLMTRGEVSAGRRPIGNRAWIRLKSIASAATIQIVKIVWVTYLGALSRLNTTLLPPISAHPLVLAQYKVHRPWALFCEGTVFWQVNHSNSFLVT